MAERRRRRRLSEEESGEEVSEDSKEVKTRDCPSECVCKLFLPFFIDIKMCNIDVNTPKPCSLLLER